MFTKLKKVLKNPLLVLKKLQRFYHSLSEIFYAYIDSKNLSNSERVLFVDLGANLGQGFRWFSRYYNSSNIDFELFEPNPFCFELWIPFSGRLLQELLACPVLQI